MNEQRLCGSSFHNIVCRFHANDKAWPLPLECKAPAAIWGCCPYADVFGNKNREAIASMSKETSE